MPCRAGNEWANYEREKIQQELDFVTRLLCEAMNAHPEVQGLSKDHEDWWSGHIKEDEQRIEKEIKQEQLRAADAITRLQVNQNELASIRDRLATLNNEKEAIQKRKKG